MKKILSIFFIILFILIPSNAFANENVNIYLFHKYDCPFCQREIEFLNELLENDNHITLYEYEVVQENHAYNRSLYNQMIELFKIERRSVPLTIIGNDYVIGFSDSIGREIQKYIEYYKENEYQDIAGIKLGVIDENKNNEEKNIEKPKDYTLNTIIGKVNLNDLSLFKISIVMGLHDGINISTLWIILFLICILININSKRNIFILGITFLGINYFLNFSDTMIWFNSSNININIIQIIFSILLIVFSLFKIYYLKNNLYLPIKKLTIPIIIVSILSIVITLITLSHSPNSRLLFSEILNNNNLIENQYMRYVMLYTLFYIIDDLLLFIISIVLLKSNIFSNLKAKYSMISCIIILIIGIIILIKPELLFLILK